MVGSGNHRVHARAEARLHHAQLPAKGFRPQEAEGREGGGTWSRCRGKGTEDTNASERKTGVDGGAESDERHRQRKDVQGREMG